MNTDLSQAVSISMPVIVKALPADGDRRLIEVQASSETVDLEGDLITQRSLLNAAPAFLARGHVDIDHLSELGGKYGIANTADWIIGKPIAVSDIGGGRTAVKAELFPNVPGLPKSKADEVWDSIKKGTQPPWRSSIFGYPQSGGIIDTRVAKSAEYPTARRYVVKAIDWRSLALTRTPVNDAITESAKIVTAKAFAFGMRQIGSHEFAKAEAPSYAEADPMRGYSPVPRSRVELMGHWHQNIKPDPDAALGNSVAGFRSYFMDTCGVDFDTADLLALALARMLKHNR
jgi:hypothetical protein